MRRELVKFILRKRFDSDSDVDRRINIYDRRKLSTYIENDRRSGVDDRRGSILKLIAKFSLRINSESRCGKSDRREVDTYINPDRRSGIKDRRSRSWEP